ncbi:MAG: zinc-ribbon domain-containing protein [Calditrichaeota bacterium]|nr:zinc-ribbon domain-containing protein [Calditrichota bacterium]
MADVKTTKFCSNCGAEIDRNAEICPKCGVRVSAAPQPTEIKNPAIAAILSFLFTGLGQIYNGQIEKGILFIIIGIILAISMLILIGIILFPLFWLYNIYDAYTSAKQINAGIIKPD